MCLLVCFMRLCTYMFVLEGLDQLRHPTESHGEGKTGAAVAVGYLNTLVAKIALPVCVAIYFILTKDVRYEVSCIEGREGKKGKWIGVESLITFLSRG